MDVVVLVCVKVLVLGPPKKMGGCCSGPIVEIGLSASLSGLPFGIGGRTGACTSFTSELEVSMMDDESRFRLRRSHKQRRKSRRIRAATPSTTPRIRPR